MEAEWERGEAVDAVRERERSKPLEEQERALRHSALTAAVEKISGAMGQLMAATYSQVFQEPEELADFLIPLTYRPPKNVPFAVVSRENVLAKCSEKTRKQVRAEAKIQWERVREKTAGRQRRWTEEDKYQSIPADWFARILSREISACTPQARRSFLDILDLAAWFKLNTQASAPKTFRRTYQALCRHCPNLEKKPLADWSQLCRQAVSIRNEAKGHDSPDNLDKLLETGLRASLAPWMEIAELLHSETLNQEEYLRVCRAMERGRACEEWVLVPFDALGRPDLEHAAIRGALESVGIPCEADCTLYHSADALARRLDQVLTGYRWVPLDQVQEMLGTETAVLEADLTDCGLKVEGDRVYCGSVEQALKLLELRQARLSAEEESQRQSREIEQLQKRVKLTEDQLKRVRQNPQLLQALRVTSGSVWSDLPRLEALADYRRGPLSAGQIQELVRTHQLVLDPSVLCSPKGIEFIRTQVVPCLKTMRKAGKPAVLVMEATARYHLYQDFEACKEAERVIREARQPTARTEEEQRELNRLRSAKTAYYFARDGLYQEGLLRYIGVPSPQRRDEEALQMFLRRNPALRVCVLTCGAVSGLTEAVSPQEFPLCAVARVSGSPVGRGEAVCQIFPDYLPLADGGQDVDLMDTLRYYDLRQETYAARSFPGGDAGEKTPAVQAERPPSRPAPSEPGAQTASPAPARSRTSVSAVGQRRPPAFPPVTELRLLPAEPLPLSRPVSVGDVLTTEEGAPVRLTDRLRDGQEAVEGGEGALYQVDLPGQAAKLYHTGPKNYKLTLDRKQKLEDMLGHNPGIPEVCWPTHLLFTGRGEFVGYLMPRAPEGTLSFQRSVLQLYKNAVQEEVLPGWDRRDLVRSAMACARLTARLHANNILMGDVNDGNFMVDPRDSGSVWLVDCDSYQFNGYPCPVGTLDYTHPQTAERLGITGDLRFGTFLRTEQEEDYALGILIFRILMLGQYPFDTRKDMSPAQAMRERLFPFTLEDVADIPEGDSWMIWKNLPKPVTRAFLNTFKEWAPPKAIDWFYLLKGYQRDIDNRGFSRELSPLKYHEFTPEKPFFQDVVCEIDGVEFNMTVKKYQYIKSHRGWHILCKNCWSTLERFERMPQTLQCGRCGREFQGNARQAYLHEKLKDVIRCPRCRGQWGKSGPET